METSGAPRVWRRPSPAAPGTASCPSAPTRSGPHFLRHSPIGGISARALSPRSARFPASPRRPAARTDPGRCELEAIAAAVPPMTGAEYVTTEVLADLWRATRFGLHDRARRIEAHRPGVPAEPQQGLEPRRPRPLQPRREPQGRRGAVRVPRDVHHTAVGRGKRAARCRSARRCRNTPARKAHSLLSLLVPVQRAAEQCAWLAAMVERGESIIRCAGRRRRAVPAAISAGSKPRASSCGCRRRGAEPAGEPAGERDRRNQGARRGWAGRAARLPDGGHPRRRTARPAREVSELLAAPTGLRLLRGRWVEIDHAELEPRSSALRAVGRAAEDGCRWRGDAAGRGCAPPSTNGEAVGRPAARDRRAVARGHPRRCYAVRAGSPTSIPGMPCTAAPALPGGRRPLAPPARAARLGACLADDMGLGKTIQIIALLLVLPAGTALAGPHCSSCRLRCSATGLPSSRASHPACACWSHIPRRDVVGGARRRTPPALAGIDLVITSYGTLSRAALARQVLAARVLDEAQAIKNPGGQTRAVKALDAPARIALTGTPSRIGSATSGRSSTS